MAGHSHAANVAARKGAVDAKRGKLFSKLCRAIYVAARTGGGDPDMNLRLRYAIDKARQYSCPKDNIERAIKKGTGQDGDGESYDEVMYEGYGPSGVAVMCQALTDNRNRTAGELRKIFEHNGGNLGSTGCVSYSFSYKGLFVVPATAAEEDALMEIVLEAGADDLEEVDGMFEVTCDPRAFDAIKAALTTAGIEPELAEVHYLPSTWVDLDVDAGKRMLRLRDALDENEDVQNVYANDNIPDEATAGA